MTGKDVGGGGILARRLLNPTGIAWVVQISVTTVNTAGHPN